ncbi:MAG: hypothetical protein Q8L64_05220 [bacterium]|nr:hypothetical protein [bacterium]
MIEYLRKSFDGTWNTVPPVAVDKIPNVNCHKFVLFTLGRMSWDDMVSDPHIMKLEGKDFMYGDMAKSLSDKDFVLIKDSDALRILADRDIKPGKTYVGQILDAETGEMAHSFLVEKDDEGRYICQEKMGFKQYPFEVRELESLLDFVNDRGEKAYQNQMWRFFSIS